MTASCPGEGVIWPGKGEDAMRCDSGKDFANLTWQSSFSAPHSTPASSQSFSAVVIHKLW